MTNPSPAAPPPEPPACCPACNSAIYNDDDVNGLRVIRYACGRSETKHPAKDYWMVFKTCPQAENVAISLRAQLTAQAERVAELEAALETCKRHHSATYQDYREGVATIDSLTAQLTALTTRTETAERERDAAVKARDLAVAYNENFSQVTRWSSGWAALWKRSAKQLFWRAKTDADSCKHALKNMELFRNELTEARAQLAALQTLRDAAVKWRKCYADKLYPEYSKERLKLAQAVDALTTPTTAAGQAREMETK